MAVKALSLATRKRQARSKAFWAQISLEANHLTSKLCDLARFKGVHCTWGVDGNGVAGTLEATKDCWAVAAMSSWASLWMAAAAMWCKRCFWGRSQPKMNHAAMTLRNSHIWYCWSSCRQSVTLVMSIRCRSWSHTGLGRSVPVQRRCQARQARLRHWRPFDLGRRYPPSNACSCLWVKYLRCSRRQDCHWHQQARRIADPLNMAPKFARKVAVLWRKSSLLSLSISAARCSSASLPVCSVAGGAATSSAMALWDRATRACSACRAQAAKTRRCRCSFCVRPWRWYSNPSATVSFCRRPSPRSRRRSSASARARSCAAECRACFWRCRCNHQRPTMPSSRSWSARSSLRRTSASGVKSRASIELIQALNATPCKNPSACCRKLRPRHWSCPSLEFCSAVENRGLSCCCCSRRLLCRSTCDNLCCAPCKASKACDRRVGMAEGLAWSMAPWKHRSRCESQGWKDIWGSPSHARYYPNPNCSQCPWCSPEVSSDSSQTPK